MSEPTRPSSTIPPTLAPRRRRPEPKKGIPAIAIVAVAVVALAAVAGLVFAGDAFRSGPAGSLPTSPARTDSGTAQGDTAAAPAPQGTPGISPVNAAAATVLREGNSLGAKGASVAVVEYADFQCPFCAQADRTVVKQLKETYVASGQVRLIFRQFPFIGNESVWAAMASECAAEQGKFWEYHDKLFGSQSGENQGAFARDKLEGFARDLGLNMDTFKPCLDSNKYLAKIREDAEEGQRLGVQSTPTFMVNDRRIQGAQSFQVFRDAIEAELKKKQ